MKYRIFLFLYIAFFIIPAGYAKDSSFANILHEMEHAGFTIRHHKEGASDKTIVLIEDAHTNYPAQKELARIIEQLTAATTIQVIAVEGSEGEILTHFFASFPIEKTRRHLADNLLKNGFISGEEYLSISSGAPLRIVGVDDRVLYKQNIEHFRDFYHARPQAHPLISQIQNGLFKAKVTAYDSILFKFDTACLSFKDGSVDLTHFLEVCEHLVPDADKLFFDFPLLNDVRIIAQQHTAFNFDTLYAQAAQAAKLIIQNGTPEQANTAREALLKNMAGKTTHSSFYRQLIVQAENNPAIDISGLNELQRYVALSEELSQIDHSVLQDEIDGFVEVCYQRLLSTAEEKELHALSSNFETLNQLYSLSLIRSDYLSMQQSTQIAEFVESFIAGYNTAAPASRISPDNTAFLAKILANNLAFYQTAVQRDTVIFENTLSLMEQQQCTATVLIAGGFHKDHIIASCAEQEIGCIVISPATAGEQDFNQYASVVLRNDRFIQPPQPDKTQGNYLRASSFFAQSSFDSAQHITAFRNNFIFEAVLDSIDTIGAGEIHSIIKAWRSGFIKALAQH
ncbi:hypothetical protein KDK77_10010, partial [bacterium]|nr:hypothetical protein [bacterium]